MEHDWNGIHDSSGQFKEEVSRYIAVRRTCIFMQNSKANYQEQLRRTKRLINFMLYYFNNLARHDNSQNSSVLKKRSLFKVCS